MWGIPWHVHMQRRLGFARPLFPSSPLDGGMLKRISSDENYFDNAAVVFECERLSLRGCGATKSIPENMKCECSDSAPPGKSLR